MARLNVDRSALWAEVRAVARASGPAVVGYLALAGFWTVDTMVVGRVGQEALAAVQLGVVWNSMLVTAPRGMLKGVEPVAAQAFGAGDRAAAGAALARAFVLAACVTVPVAALHLLARRGLDAMGEPPPLLDAAGEYCRALVPGLLPMYIFGVLRDYLQAVGVTRPATAVIVVANLAHIPLTLWLVGGGLGLPPLGALGAGLSTSLTELTMAVLLLVLCRHEVRAALGGGSADVDVSAVARLGWLGVPVGLHLVVESGAFMAVGLLMGRIGTAELAGHAIALNVCIVSFMVALGISSGAATRVGNRVGAVEPWGMTAVAGLLLGLGVMSVSALVFACFPEAIARLYTHDVEVVRVAGTLVVCAAVFQLFDGTQVVASGVLRGAGDLRSPALITLGAYWVVGLPVGAWLAFSEGKGALGLWIGLTIGLAICAVLLSVRVRMMHTRGARRVG